MLYMPQTSPNKMFHNKSYAIKEGKKEQIFPNKCHLLTTVVRLMYSPVTMSTE